MHVPCATLHHKGNEVNRDVSVGVALQKVTITNVLQKVSYSFYAKGVRVNIHEQIIKENYGEEANSHFSYYFR